MFPKVLAALLAFAVCAQAAAPPAKPWQRVDGCRWKADRWNDGDSFHVVTGNAWRTLTGAGTDGTLAV